MRNHTAKGWQNKGSSISVRIYVLWIYTLQCVYCRIWNFISTNFECQCVNARRSFNATPKPEKRMISVFSSSTLQYYTYIYCTIVLYIYIILYKQAGIVICVYIYNRETRSGENKRPICAVNISFHLTLAYIVYRVRHIQKKRELYTNTNEKHIKINTKRNLILTKSESILNNDERVNETIIYIYESASESDMHDRYIYIYDHAHHTAARETNISSV